MKEAEISCTHLACVDYGLGFVVVLIVLFCICLQAVGFSGDLGSEIQALFLVVPPFTNL